MSGGYAKGSNRRDTGDDGLHGDLDLGSDVKPDIGSASSSRYPAPSEQGDTRDDPMIIDDSEEEPELRVSESWLPSNLGELNRQQHLPQILLHLSCPIHRCRSVIKLPLRRRCDRIPMLLLLVAFMTKPQ